LQISIDRKSSMIAAGSNKYPFQLAIYLGPSARPPPNGACQPRDIPSPQSLTCLVPLRTSTPPLCGRNNTRSPANPVARATRSPTVSSSRCYRRAMSVRAPETTKRKLPVVSGSHPTRGIDAQDSEYSTEFRTKMDPVKMCESRIKADYYV